MNAKLLTQYASIQIRHRKKLNIVYSILKIFLRVLFKTKFTHLMYTIICSDDLILIQKFL